MTNANPYQAPADVTSTDPDPARRAGSTVGIQFESDWSPEGLRQRRKSEWQSVGDIGFAILTVAWLGSLLMSAGSPYSGLFCLLTFVWIVVCVLWFSNVSYRNGVLFRKKFPGLAGPVTGRVEANVVHIQGQALTVIARRKDCIHCMVHADRAMIQPPGVDTVLPIIESDIVDSWQFDANDSSDHSPVDLLGRWAIEGNPIIVSGDLRGSDLRNQNCWRVWLWAGVVCMTIGTLVIAWSAYYLANLPGWIMNPPDHYRRSDADMRSVMGPSLLILMFSCVFLVGLWNLSRTWRSVGSFSALISPTLIAIVNKRVALGYHHTALDHFQWTESGMLVRDASRRVLFLIPARWFEEDTRLLAASWYQRPTTEPPGNYYVGPKV